MNTYLNFERGEISIYLAGDALANLQYSLEHAEAIRRDPRHGAVLYVNTSFTTRKFRSSWREHISGSDGIYSLDCPIGELLWQFNDMKEMVKKYNIRQMIIKNWEYAFKNYQNKEEAIFRLHEFLNKEVSLLVYAQANPDKTKAGKIMRGGLGKLSGLALSIFDLAKEREKEEQEAEISGTDSQSVSEALTGGLRVRPTNATKNVRVENVNLVGNKINDLDSAQHSLIIPEQEETGGGVFSVNETGLISYNNKHLPMSNKNRKLLAEYEKLYGKAQLSGETYRDMFDRVVGKMIAERAEIMEMVEA